MNKRQLEVQKKQLQDEKKVFEELKKIYEQASRDCETKIRELSMRDDMVNIQTIVYQQQYQDALKKQIDSVLNDLNTKSFKTVSEYLGESYENGFIGTLYDLQGQDIPLIFPIDQEQVVEALQTNSKISGGLYKRMGEDTQKLKDSIRAQLSRGTLTGLSWNQIAANIAEGMNSPFNKALNRTKTIARTEGHRVQQDATFHCQQKAKERGANVMKQWDSTLDGKTRPTHKELDQQLREIEEPFEVAGKKAMYPGEFGDPSEDCNCRCCLLQRARWMISKQEYFTKWDGDKKELVKIKNEHYDEFKENYKAYVKKDEFRKFESREESRKFFAENGGNDWIDSITSEQLKVIDDYTYNGYQMINAALDGRLSEEDIERHSRLMKVDLKKKADIIESALDNFNLTEGITVYRDESLSSLPTDLDIGKTMNIKSFLSTNATDEVFEDRDTRMIINVPPGKGVGAYIDPISHINGLDGENEFLLNCSSQLEVTDIYEDGDKTIVVCNHIGRKGRERK